MFVTRKIKIKFYQY